ncbi:MAG: PilZ domain-containing protein [Deltaproteobacteria bacterium]|nr:PilZ domain-containing protein [Deltaproteobacteria bacterium]
MVFKEAERRTCDRFVIPGATVTYKKDTLFRNPDYSYYEYPVYNISKGGINFFCDNSLIHGVSLILKLTIPDEEEIIIRGKVAWITMNMGESWKYQVGVQFEPYGEKRGQNSHDILEKINLWEGKYRESGE